MRKRDELNNPAACMMRARDDEFTFVLLARDEAAPVAIRAWIAERLRLGKNRPDDAQMLEAERCARTMEAERGPKVADVAPAAGPETPDRLGTGAEGEPRRLATRLSGPLTDVP